MREKGKNKDKKEQSSDQKIIAKDWGLNDFAVCLG